MVSDSRYESQSQVRMSKRWKHIPVRNVTVIGVIAWKSSKYIATENVVWKGHTPEILSQQWIC